MLVALIESHVVTGITERMEVEPVGHATLLTEEIVNQLWNNYDADFDVKMQLILDSEGRQWRCLVTFVDANMIDNAFESAEIKEALPVGE